MIRSSMAGLTVVLGCALVVGCQETTLTSLDSAERRLEAQGSKKLDPEICSPAGGGFTLNSTNPYFPMDVGDQWSFEGEEDGVPVSLLITVLNQTRDIAGVTTRVIEEREWEDGGLLEVSYNYFAQAADGTICYFGEDVDIYENGISHEGAWCAEDAGNAPGIFMPADPKPGMEYPIEIAPEVAEDRGMIVGGGPVTVPYGTFASTIRIRESNPLESGLPSPVGGRPGFKVFAEDFGLVVDGPLELEDFQEGQVPPAPPISGQACGTP